MDMLSTELFFDGGANPNPGPGGAGALLIDPGGKTVWEGSSFVGTRATNNEAEYRGLINGLTQARTLGLTRLVVKGDSQLVVRQMTGEYKVKAANLLPLHNHARALARTFKSISFKFIPRAQNARADALATSGIALGGAFMGTAAGALSRSSTVHVEGAVSARTTGMPPSRVRASTPKVESRKRARADDDAVGNIGITAAHSETKVARSIGAAPHLSAPPLFQR